MTTVDTPSGRVAGQRVDGDDRGPGVHRFTGVPYGQAPVGALRLRPPVAIAPWSGTLDATVVAPRSVQPSSLLAPAGDPEGEDCLYLNVWTPDPAGSVPVMVWIHGGSFNTGSGAITWYDGGRLAQRGVVVVTINYRLGPLGFLDLAAVGGDAWAGCSNVGLQDQTLALAWVRDHISAFGGDPERVTIFGESAGAMSVSTHLALPASQGLFRRAIAQSGAAGHVQSAESGARVTARALEVLGVSPKALDGLAHIPVDAFRELSSTIQDEDPDRDVPLPFRPTVDGVVLPVAPHDALAAGGAAGIDLVSGTNRDEMNLFRLVALLAGGGGELDDERLLRRVGHALARRDAAASPADVVDAYRSHHAGAANADLWCAIASDLTFRLPMVTMLDAHTTGGGRAWSYHFAHASTGFGGSLGAAHAVEIPFVFDNLDRPGTDMMLGEITPERRRFAGGLADRWSSFAIADDPARPGSGWTVPGIDDPWPRFEPAGHAQVVIDLESSVVEGLQDDLLALWAPASGPATSTATAS